MSITYIMYILTFRLWKLKLTSMKNITKTQFLKKGENDKLEPFGVEREK